MIVYNSRFLTRGEVWFDEEGIDRRGLDWIQYHHCANPMPRTKTGYFHTYLLDLAPSPQELMARINKDTAYKIRRARDKDKVICEFCDPTDPLVLDGFEAMHNRFAAVKGLSPMDRRRLNSMVAAGILEISVAKDAQGIPQVYHANYRNSERTCLEFSASLFREVSDSAARNAIGRANRYLFWTEIVRAREQGLKCFDFGGWYPGTTDQGLLNVNEFKRGFGGRVVREYECEQILSLRGWLVLRVAALVLGKKRKGAENPDSASPPIPIGELKTSTNC
jgi:hypothetical protein